MRAAVLPRSVPLLIVVGAAVQAPNAPDRDEAGRLHAEAKALAANPGKRREALDRYKKAEEEVYRLFERSFVSRAKEDQALFERQYRGILDESNALCAAVFTSETIANVPWIDLLAPDRVKDWIASSVEGFSWRIERGTLRIVGPAKGSGKKGILSIGDREKWRDFVLEFEVTFESGEIELFVRLGPFADRRAMSVSLAVAPGDLTPGTPYGCEISCIGNRFVLKVGDRPPFETETPWTVSRKGSIGLVVDEGTKVKFSRMRIRALR